MASGNKNIVLVVEDDVKLRDILKMMCEKQGWEVQVAGNGQEAFDQAKKHGPSVVLLDLLMPVLDGFGFLKLLRGYSEKDVAETPVVVLSNLYTNEDILEATSLKIEAYFVKANTSLDEVIKRTEEIINKK